MSQKTPPPPPVISGVLAPLLWTVAQPQLFDSYSIGLILLQICVPQLRGKNVMQPNGAFQLRLRDAGYDSIARGAQTSKTPSRGTFPR